MPRITVHIPCYNYGRFLADALDSVLGQSFTDWEAVVIDDASTDETATVLARYRDPRIRAILHAVNQGHLQTFNEGIEQASGELFVILSADDRYRPMFLERVVDFFDEHPEVAFVTTNGDRIDESGRVIGTNLVPFTRTGIYDALPPLFDRNFVGASAGVARTADVRSLGGYDLDLRHSADRYLWRRLAISGPLGYVHERLYERRIHPEQLSNEALSTGVVGERALQLTRIFDTPDLPARVRALRGLAYSEFHWKIAMDHYAKRRPIRTLARMARAVRFDLNVVRRHSRAARHPAAIDRSVYVHETACCESAEVGAGTKIWAFAHVMAGARLGIACKVGDHAFVETGAIIGDRVTIKNGTLVWDCVVIEDDVFVGPGVVFTNDLAPRTGASRHRDQLLPTRVCVGASIGANATIVCGTTIGRYAMVGAGSVVSRDVAAYAVIVGNPGARVGWVCECGLRLASNLQCDCGRRYRLIEGSGVIEPEDS